MPFTNNYSFNNLIKQFHNFEFLDDSSNISKRTLSLYFRIHLEFERLDLQSIVFADNIYQHAYFEFSKILQCRDVEVTKKLKNVYIYSFVKALYNALFFSSISSMTRQGLCFRGHCAFYQMIRNPNFSKTEDPYSVYATLNLPDENERMILMSLIFKKYPFLKTGVSCLDSRGNRPFLIPEWEVVLQRLNDSRSVRNEVINNESGIRNVQSNENSSNPRIKNEDGRLIILDLHDNIANSILNESNIPITNVLLGIDSNDLYFSPVNGSKFKVENNESFFFCLANFIRFTDSNLDINKFYYRSDYDFESKKYFIASEVYTNTGIKCRIFNSDKNKNRKAPILPSIKDISDKIFDLPNVNIDSILEIINNLIEVKENIEKVIDKEEGVTNKPSLK